MRSHFLYLATALLLVIGFGSNCAANPRSSPNVGQAADNEAIVWGGDHIQLRLTNTGGTVEFDCATGTIPKALAVNEKGNFHASGTYTLEAPGPTTREGNSAVTATYSGSIVGGTMRLHIVTAPGKAVVGDYVLVRGESGRVTKCR